MDVTDGIEHEKALNSWQRAFTVRRQAQTSSGLNVLTAEFRRTLKLDYCNVLHNVEALPVAVLHPSVSKLATLTATDFANSTQRTKSLVFRS
jgi:hypothetical protein